MASTSKMKPIEFNEEFFKNYLTPYFKMGKVTPDYTQSDLLNGKIAIKVDDEMKSVIVLPYSWYKNIKTHAVGYVITPVDFNPLAIEYPKRKIRLYGGFHKAKGMNVRIPEDKLHMLQDGTESLDNILTPTQKRMLNKHFCGVPGCSCGGYRTAKIKYNF